MPGPFRKLSSAQRHAFIACFLGWSLDAFDYFILVFCISAVSADFHERPSRVAEALFLTLAFRPVGAFLFGALAERFGRRSILMLNIASYSALEMACAFAPTFTSLLVLRALFGIAMGGEWGVGAALAFETLPKENRGFFSGLLQEGYAVGYLMAAAAYAALFPFFSHLTWHGHSFGWRGLFLVGAAPALVVFYIGRKVEESPAWVEGRRSGALQKKKQDQAGWMEGILRYAPTFLFVVLLMTAFNSFSHGTQDLYPTFLQKDHHFSVRLTGIIAIIYNIGALSGGMLFGTLSEKIGRKRAIIAAALLSLPVIPLYALSHSVFALTAGAFLMQFMVQGAWGVVPAYLSELSPGPVRATFPGFAYQLGNLISSRNDVLQAKAAERYGSYGVVLAATVLMVACVLAVMTCLGREARGADLTTV
ncbi:MFS transporter [Paracidobacterium acidisoli]|uniref:MFS transporter n=1 Tax=Paracidobacterium acidisoli TaxID=2303751 RepID=A0A372IJA6_9BACT|nr:MFS transporter [Paracidobacterium acidisoli]